METLHAHPAQWVDTLRRLLTETEAALRSANHISGPERAMVIDDLTGERDALRRALHRLAPDLYPDPDSGPQNSGPGRSGARPTTAAAGRPRRAAHAPGACRDRGRTTASCCGPGAPPSPTVAAEELDRLMARPAPGRSPGSPHAGIPLPSGGKALAVSAPVGDALGWLVGVGAGQLAVDAAPSLRWLGRVAVWATELVAQGRVVPSLVEANPGGSGGGKGGRASTGEYQVRWAPAVLEPERLKECVSKMPGAVSALEQAGQPYRMCRAVLGAAADAVCRAGASRLVTPATVPVARSRSEVSEAVLAGLAGEPFQAAARAASEMADDMARWTTPVTSDRAARLTVRLGRRRKTTAAGSSPSRRRASPAPTARAGAPAGRRGAPQRPARPGGGGGDRAAPPGAAAAGSAPPGQAPGQGRHGRHRGLRADDHRRRASSRRPASPCGSRSWPRSGRRPASSSTPRPSAASRWSAPSSCPRVQWSVAVDDVTLDAAAIRKLAAQARPLVQTKGGWVELDKADLEAAAEALAARSKRTEMSGAEILRHAVGLKAGTGGPVLVDGAGWAVDLVHGAAAGAARPLPAPEGFVGELRHYQAEARGWLGFLDRAGLGGCLAMDMGLGKTPTVLAHLLEHKDDGPVAGHRPAGRAGQLGGGGGPVHPGARRCRSTTAPARASGEDVAEEAAEADIVLTTYATARARRRGAGQGRLGPPHRRRGPGHQEPGQRHRPGAAPHPGPQPPGPDRHPGGERPRRPVVDPRLHQPRPRRAPPGVHRGAVPAPADRRGGRRRRRRRAHGAGPSRASRPCGPSTGCWSSAAPRRSRRSPPSCPTRSTSSTTAP